MAIANQGTVSVAADSATVTGANTAFDTGSVAGGILFIDGLAAHIASVESETALTLTQTWKGGAKTDAAYLIDLENAAAAGQVATHERVSLLLDRLRDISPLGSEVLSKATAAEIRETLELERYGVSQVGTHAERAGYDTEAKNFGYLATDPPTIYYKLSNTSADWSAGAALGKGDTGDTGATGPQGDTGPQGIQGDTGPQGIQGETGATGPQGDAYPIGVEGLFTGRAAYDGEAANFSYLAVDTATLYWKLSATSGDWSSGVTFGKGETGLQGEKGDSALKNHFINGGFHFWQRATSQTLSGYGSDDRWFNGNYGSTKTHTRQAFSLGQTDVPGNPKYYSRTVVNSVAGPANFAYKFQPIEGVENFAGGKATLVFWAKADSIKNIAVELFQFFGTGGSPSAGVPGIGELVALSSSWQKYEIVVDVPSIAGKTLGVDGNDYIAPIFWFEAGSAYAARAASVGQQSGTFDLAEMEIFEGDVLGQNVTSVPFDHANELVRCQRFFEAIDGFVPSLPSIVQVHYKVHKRAVPTISGGGAGFTSSGVVTQDMCYVGQTNGSAQRLLISAEL